MNVTLPNGTVIEGVPDDATKDQIMQKAISAGLAVESDFTETAAPVQAAVQKTGLENIKSVYDAPELSQFNLPAIKASVGGLLTGNPDELASILKSQYPDANVNAGLITLPSGTYEIKSSAPARFVTDMGSFMVGGPMTGALKSRLAKEGARAMAVESAQQGIEAGVGGEFNPKDVALSGVTDVIGASAGEMLSGLLRGVAGKMSSSSADLLKTGEQAGVPIMTSDVLPPRTFMSKSLQTFYERIPMVGTGSRREFQKAAREGALDKLAADFGVTADIPFTDDVIDSLKNVKTERLSLASKLKNQSRSVLSSAGEVPKSGFIEAIDKAIAAELKFGTKADKALIESLEAWKNTPNGDFAFMDGLRSRLGDEISDYYTGKNSQIGSKGVGYLQGLKNALTEDMDMFAASLKDEGMTKAALDWKRANAMFFDEYSKYKDSALKTMLDKGDLKPEIVLPILKGKSPSQVKLLYDNLDATGRNSAKSAILQDMLQQAGKSPEKFLTSMDKMDKNLKIFFKDKDMDVLKGYQRLLQSTTRGATAGVRTPTGQELYGLALVGGGYGASTLSPGLAAVAGATALGGRVFESGPVRNALLKLNNTPVNSVAYDRVLRNAMNEIKAATQAMRDEDE